MNDIIESITNWRQERKAVALATVIETWGSSPRQAGAKMAMTPDGQIAGSVSGGCVEGAVYEAGLETLAAKRPQLLHFGVADETAWEVGLACGGEIEVFVEPLNASLFDQAEKLLAEEQPFALVSVIGGPADLLGVRGLAQPSRQPAGEWPAGWPAALLPLAEEAIRGGQPVRLAQTLPGSETALELFIEPHLPAPRLVMVGGVHIAIALAEMARTVGFRTLVIDPRRAFGSQDRFPHADKLIQAWPEEAFREIELNSAVAAALLTHDPKIDDPALKILLTSDVYYIGALGSRRTHARRQERLRQMGFSQAQIERIHAPIGLDIGAQTPAEIALSVLAEIVAARRQGE